MLKVLYYYDPPRHDKLYVGRIDFMADRGTYRVVCSYGKRTADLLSDHPKGEYATYNYAANALMHILHEKISKGYVYIAQDAPMWNTALRKIDISRLSTQDPQRVRPLSDDLRRGRSVAPVVAPTTPAKPQDCQAVRSITF